MEKVEIKKGSIVKFENSNYMVTSLRGGKVNLGSIFGSRIYHKGVPVERVTENANEWYDNWTKSETYMCM
jgi:predicted nucleotide-binding protein (sugar kinase/HSP70/actin superfamily)